MYNIKFSIDKEQMIFLVKKAVLFRYTIVKDSGDEIVVGTPPSYLTTVTIKAQSVEFQGNIAISNSCSAVIKRELAKYEAKQNKLAKKEAKQKEEAEQQPEEKKPEVKDAAVAERLELAVLLERYKQLLDSGAISEEDYEKRKQEILAMMEFEKKEEEQPAPEVQEEPKAEPKEEVVPAPVVVEEVQPAPQAIAQPVQQPQPQVVIINNQAPAQAAQPVEEKKPKEKCPTLYKVFAILFGIILLAGGAALIVFYFLLPKLTIDPSGANVENANGLGAISELFTKKYAMTTELTNTILKDKFTISGLIAGGIAGVAAVLGSLFTFISIKPKEAGKIVLNSITLILGGGSVIYLIMNKTMDIVFLAVAGVTAFAGLALIILAFVKPKEK